MSSSVDGESSESSLLADFPVVLLATVCSSSAVLFNSVLSSILHPASSATSASLEARELEVCCIMGPSLSAWGFADEEVGMTTGIVEGPWPCIPGKDPNRSLIRQLFREHKSGAVTIK